MSFYVYDKEYDHLVTISGVYEKEIIINDIRIKIVKVVDNDDGTITKSMSIYVSGYKLYKTDHTKGFNIIKNGRIAKTKGQKKKWLAEIRRMLGMPKREFSKLMGMLGGYW